MTIKTVKVALRGHPRLKYKIVNAEDVGPDDALYVEPSEPSEVRAAAQKALEDAEKAEALARKKVLDLQAKLDKARDAKSKGRINAAIAQAVKDLEAAGAAADEAHEALAELTSGN